MPKRFINTSELKKNKDHFSLSLYNDELTAKNVLLNITKIKKVFPNLEIGFYDILTERLKDKGFTDNKFNDAVNHVIDNCIYPTPTIANFLSFDRNIKLYSYEQMLKLNNEYAGQAFKYFRPIKINNLNKPMYASKNDIEKYNLTEWKQ